MTTADPRSGEDRAVRLLTFSTLYPNAAQPNHGVFVENRLRHLVATGEAGSTVLAPVPWFPRRLRAVRRLGPLRRRAARRAAARPGGASSALSP